MRKIIFIYLFIFNSCATFSDNAKYAPTPNSTEPLLIELKASFDTQIGNKYAYLNTRNVGSDMESCSLILPGDSNDAYLKSILCKTYYSLGKSHQVRLVSSEAEVEKSKIIHIDFKLSEQQGFLHQVWSWTNILTLTIVPYRGIRTFEVRISSVEGNQKYFEEVHSADFVEWRSIFLIPAMPFLDGYQIATDKTLASLLNKIDSDIDRKK